MNNQLRTVYIAFIAIGTVMFATACKDDPAIPGEDDQSLRFVLEASNNPALPQNIELFQYHDGTVSALTPHEIAPPATFTLTFNIPNDHELWLNDELHPGATTTITLGTPLYCAVVDTAGDRKDYRIELFPDPGIPVFWIETEDNQPIVSKDDYLDATLKVNPGALHEQVNRLIDLEIRGRGNSTWGMPKKPYRMRFNQNEPILGFPETRNWVLLANYADKTLLRNHVAFEMGHLLMDGFSPRTQFVAVYLNGQYDGVYHLTDQIRVEEARVNIDELDRGDTDAETITGGYLLEVDERLDEDHWFYSAILDMPFTFKSPEDPNDEQRQYITEYINELEAIITDPNIGMRTDEYQSYIDIPSFVDFYIISEVTRNNDTGGNLSVYMHKPRGEKLYIGPLWDFDIALGNINYNGNDQPEGWWIKTENRWYRNLFNDDQFAQNVKTRWMEVKPLLLTTLMDKIDEAAYHTLKHAHPHNFQRWDILNEWVWPNAVVLGSYEAEVEYLKEWLHTRVNWMDSEINGW